MNYTTSRLIETLGHVDRRHIQLVLLLLTLILFVLTGGAPETGGGCNGC